VYKVPAARATPQAQITESMYGSMQHGASGSGAPPPSAKQRTANPSTRRICRAPPPPPPPPDAAATFPSDVPTQAVLLLRSRARPHDQLLRDRFFPLPDTTIQRLQPQRASLLVRPHHYGRAHRRLRRRGAGECCRCWHGMLLSVTTAMLLNMMYAGQGLRGQVQCPGTRDVARH
jgi:hypothetical protein